MARSRPLHLRRPTGQNTVHRVYAVCRGSSVPQQARCHLDDGGAVLCAFQTISVALEAVSSSSNIELVRHRSLSPKEQNRVTNALLA